MDLSRRLYTVASAVTPGCRLADVGTDHGYVPIFLMERGLCEHAIAMDINKGPLERAVEHIEKEGLSDKIETRLSDGMMKLQAGEVDSVIIAGMGGDLISRILRAREDLLEEGLELVLQPQSEWFKVRHSLHDMKYQIVKEWFLKEDGKYYTVIKAIPGEEFYETESEYAYGSILEEECYPVLEEYLDREIAKKEAIMASLKASMAGITETETMEEGKKNLCRNEQRIEELDLEIRHMKERLRAGR